MRRNDLSWPQATCYVGVAAISAALLAVDQPPEIAAIPGFLVWMLINRKWSQ